MNSTPRTRIPGGPVLNAVSRLTAAMILPALLIWSIPVQLQARAFTSEVVEGTTLRCSTARTGSIPEKVLDRYGVSENADVGLLSCVIQRQEGDGGWSNRRGKVTATASTLTGIAQPLEVREILDESDIGYIATYTMPHDGPLSFDVSVQTEGIRDIRIEFDDLRPRQ